VIRLTVKEMVLSFTVWTLLHAIRTSHSERLEYRVGRVSVELRLKLGEYLAMLLGEGKRRAIERNAKPQLNRATDATRSTDTAMAIAGNGLLDACPISAEFRHAKLITVRGF
jgi:hypothetical protein